jgi:histidinol-phosphate aminotransferase
MSIIAEKGGGSFHGIKLLLCDILIKPLNDPALGPGFMRITTALPEDNRRFVDALRTLLT